MLTKPKGTYDILPNEARIWAKLETVIRKVCNLANYEEIRTPIFEAYETFHRNEDDSSDMVTKETYDFLDRGDRKMTLRPEGTAGCVRAFIENKLYVLNKVTKLFYLGPMFRYERPQKGRYRQFMQFGLEAYGPKSPLLDVDIISTAVMLLKALGFMKVRVRINTLGDKESRNNYRNVLVDFFSKNIDLLCSDCKQRLEKNPLRILDCKIDKENEILKNAPKISDYLNDDSKTHFNKVLEELDKINIKYVVDPHLVRGLDYYSDTVFEIEYESDVLGNQNVLCAGGRYNDLVKDLGGPDIPGVGLAFGMDRLLLALANENINIIKPKMLHAYLITLGNDCSDYGLKLIYDLRLAGITCDMSYTKASLKAQFKEADNNNSLFTLILGEDELNKQTINVKNNQTKEQVTLNISELKGYLIKNLTQNSCHNCGGNCHEKSTN